MDKSVQKYLIYLNGLFAVTATLGQVISIPNPWIIYGVFLPNVLAWIYFLFLYSKISPPLPSNSSIRALGQRMATDEITFRHIRTSVELDQIWLIDSRIYGENNISKDALYDWYRKFTKGAYVMYNGVKFLGYVGIYPLQKNSFEKIRSGILKEERMSGVDFCSDEEAKNCETWYFSGFALDRSRSDLFDKLMAASFYNWAEWFNNDQTIEAISFAYPGPDANFLDVAGFYEVRKSNLVEEMPVVGRVFTKAEIILLARTWSNDNELFASELSE